MATAAQSTQVPKVKFLHILSDGEHSPGTSPYRGYKFAADCEIFAVAYPIPAAELVGLPLRTTRARPSLLRTATQSQRANAGVYDLDLHNLGLGDKDDGYSMLYDGDFYENRVAKALMISAEVGDGVNLPLRTVRNDHEWESSNVGTIFVSLTDSASA
jgi:hypothetical protein